MGRKKVTVQKIEDPRARQVTFTKRKAGLMKKAMELSVLCDCQVAVFIFDVNNHLSEYCSTNDPRSLIQRYNAISHLPHERFENSDFLNLDGDSLKKRPRWTHEEDSDGEVTSEIADDVSSTTNESRRFSYPGGSSLSPFPSGVLPLHLQPMSTMAQMLSTSQIHNMQSHMPTPVFNPGLMPPQPLSQSALVPPPALPSPSPTMQLHHQLPTTLSTNNKPTLDFLSFHPLLATGGQTITSPSSGGQPMNISPTNQSQPNTARVFGAPLHHSQQIPTAMPDQNFEVQIIEQDLSLFPSNPHGGAMSGSFPTLRLSSADMSQGLDAPATPPSPRDHDPSPRPSCIVVGSRPRDTPKPATSSQPITTDHPPTAAMVEGEARPVFDWTPLSPPPPRSSLPPPPQLDDDAFSFIDEFASD